MRVELARSAGNHKIGKAHMLAAIAGGLELVKDMGNGNGMWTATDDRGVELEIGMRPADEDPNTMIVYHCMPTHYRKGN